MGPSDRQYRTVQFQISLSDIDLNSRSQFYERGNTFDLIFLTDFTIDSDEIYAAFPLEETSWQPSSCMLVSSGLLIVAR